MSRGNEIRGELVRELAIKRRRAELLPAELDRDPVWNILLDLALSALNRRAICISSACIASGRPATTALRYITLIVDGQYARRFPDPDDSRRHWLEITAKGMAVVSCILLNSAPYSTSGADSQRGVSIELPHASLATVSEPVHVPQHAALHNSSQCEVLTCADAEQVLQ